MTFLKRELRQRSHDRKVARGAPTGGASNVEKFIRVVADSWVNNEKIGMVPTSSYSKRSLDWWLQTEYDKSDKSDLVSVNKPSGLSLAEFSRRVKKRINKLAEKFG